MTDPTPVPPSLSPHAARVDRLRRLSFFLDNAIPIPGTRFRIGLDPILGLLPGGGDTIAGLLSAYIVVEAARMGVSGEVLGQMLGNVLVDLVLGSIPIIGDLFDAGWKANARNIALLERHLHLSPTGRTNRWFLVVMIVVLAIVVFGFAALTMLVVRALWIAIAGG